MWSSDRRFFCLGALAALSSCGFTPVHGTGGSAAGLRGQIDFVDPTTRTGFVLVKHLEDRLGLPSAPRYRMAYRVQTTSSGLAISNSNNVERVNLNGVLDYSMTDLTTGQVVTADSVRSFTSYATTVSTVSTRAAEQDAEDRLMIILGDLAIARLLATAPDWA